MRQADEDDLEHRRSIRSTGELPGLYEDERARRAELEAALANLREAEAKYRALVERIPAVTYVDMIDPTKPEKVRETYMSPQVESMLAYAAEEFMADPDLWDRILHPDDRDRALAEDAHHYETGEPLDHEYRVISRDGRIIWVRDMATVVRDEQGRPRFSQGVIFDVTAEKQAEEAQVRYTGRLESLRQIDLAILSAESIEDLIRAALSRLQGLVPSQRATVSLFDFEAGEVTIFVTTYTGETALTQGARVPIQHWGAFGEDVIQRLRSGQVVVKNDLAAEPDPSPGLQAMRDEGARSLLTAPLWSQGDLIGVLSLTAHEPAAFSSEHAEIAGEVANQLAIAIRHARLRQELEAELAERKRAEEALRRHAERLEGLRQIDLAILAADSIELLVRAALSRLQRLVTCQRASVALIDFEAGDVTIFVTIYTGETALTQGARVPLEHWGAFGEDIIQRLRSGQVVVKNDLAAEPDPSPGLQAMRDEGARSLLTAPLLSQGVLIGVLSLRGGKTEAFASEHAEIAGEVANQLAIAIHHARLREELEDELAERKRAEEETRRSEARKSAILEAALDCVITIDHEGRVLEFNPAAERTFGYERNDVIGKKMAELIIPPALRDAHHRGLAHYLATGEGPVVGKRLELTAMRADGTEFPVELAITRVDLPGDPVFTGYLRDITERTRAGENLRETLDQLRSTDEQRQRLLSRLVNAQEEERSRIAEDIHDDSIQVMTAVGMRLDLLRRSIDDPEQLDLLKRLEETVTLTTQRLRNLLFELRPRALDREGLAPALRVYVEQYREEGGPTYKLENRMTKEPPTEARVILYRIAQEALTNVRKHAAASAVDILLEDRGGGVLVQIKDDGVGFSSVNGHEDRPGHLGLAAIRERAEMAAGWCRVESSPGAGTTVEFWVPASIPNEEERR